jgi:hypothetical protein
MIHTLPLHVDFGDARPAHPYPVRGGIPFAMGMLRSAEHIRLTTGEREHPCQVARTAVWPDGSVKWVLLDFFALPGDRLTLEYGDSVRRTPAANGIIITPSDGSISVDTGVLRIRVDRAGAGFLDRLCVQGEDWLETAERDARRHVLDFIHAACTGDRPTQTAAFSGVDDPSRVAIDVLEVEAPGPLHAVILLRGRHLHRQVGTTIDGVTQRGACPFSLRLHLWAGMGLLGAEHFFVYEGDPDVDFVRQAGMGLTLPVVREADTLAAGTDRGRETVSLAPGRACGVYQASADHFEVWQADGAAPVETVVTGGRASGWCHACGPRGGVAFGIRHFWQQYHKSLQVDTRTGRIDAWMWPPEAPALDYRRYARAWGVGEDGAYENGPMPCNYRLAAKGTGKSHELLFYFHTGAADGGEIEALFAAFQNRPLVLAPPAYYAGTKALGHYLARTEDGFDDLEKVIQRPIAYLCAAQEQSRWYGFFDFGDVQTCYATFHRHDRWESDFGRWGWANGDQVGRLNYALMLQFVRTGDRRHFAFAEANMRHVHDVDATHTHEYPFKMGAEFRDLAGSVHRHNAQHWACPYVGSRGAHPAGARIHYFLTGSGRSGDILDEVLALAERLPEGAARDGHGAGALSFLCAWERTGQAAYRDKTLQILQSYGLEKIQGGWMAMISAAFGVFDAMVEYTDLSGDGRFIPVILEFAGMCMGPEIEQNWTYPGGYFRIYAEALRFSDRPDRLLEGIARARARLNEQMAGSSSYLPAEQWPAPRGAAGGAFSNFSIDANTLRDLPFLMYGLAGNRDKKQGGLPLSGE